jgi:hypothetical protein
VHADFHKGRHGFRAVGNDIADHSLSGNLHFIFLLLDKEKVGRSKHPTFLSGGSGLLSHLSKALAAVDGTIGLGLKGNPGLAAAGSAGGGEELTGTTCSVLAGVTARLAALRLVLEAALCIELLLTGGKNELFTAFFAY